MRPDASLTLSSGQRPLQGDLINASSLHRIASVIREVLCIDSSRASSSPRMLLCIHSVVLTPADFAYRLTPRISTPMPPYALQSVASHRVVRRRALRCALPSRASRLAAPGHQKYRAYARPTPAAPSRRISPYIERRLWDNPLISLRFLPFSEWPKKAVSGLDKPKSLLCMCFYYVFSHCHD